MENTSPLIPEAPPAREHYLSAELRRLITKSITRACDLPDEPQDSNLATPSRTSDQPSSQPPTRGMPISLFASSGFTKRASPPPEEFELVTKVRASVKLLGKRKLAPSSEKEYQKKARTLAKWRLTPVSPPDIAPHVSSSNSFYAYKAALIWDAVERAKHALNQRDKFPFGTPEHTAAVAALELALADLAHYPPDPKGDQFNAYTVQDKLHRIGMDEAPKKGQFAQAKAEGKTRQPERKHGQAYYAGRLNQKLTGWRAKIWDRLKQINSPWLLQAATASLTGCRPEELEGIRIELLPDNRLQFTIKGAKVSAAKGQPVRTLKVWDLLPEFDYLTAVLKKNGGTLTLQSPTGKDREGNSVPLKNPPAAFAVAVKRAANQALGKHWHFSAYCFRHALAADLKADGMDREDLAQVLGHAVTETASCYGRYSGGLVAARDIEAQGSRVVKNNHRTQSAQHGKADSSPPTTQPVMSTFIDESNDESPGLG